MNGDGHRGNGVRSLRLRSSRALARGTDRLEVRVTDAVASTPLGTWTSRL